jgi:hypothetical protein
VDYLCGQAGGLRVRRRTEVHGIYGPGCDDVLWVVCNLQRTQKRVGRCCTSKIKLGNDVKILQVPAAIATGIGKERTCAINIRRCWVNAAAGGWLEYEQRENCCRFAGDRPDVPPPSYLI